MSASNTDLFKKARANFSTTVAAGGISSGATTLPLTDVTGLDTDTAVVVVVDAVDPTTGAATPDLKEVIVGVVGVGSLTSCVRGKEGTTAQAHAEGAIVTMYFTETHWDDLINGILAEHNQDGTHKASVLQAVYPVGSIYISTVSTNPNTLFGFGTWAAFAAGRTLIGVGTSDRAFAAAATGGESTHTLTITEMPAHTHSYKVLPNRNYSGSGLNPVDPDGSDTGDTTGSTGGGAAHNNLPPYIVTYIWQRTA